MNRHEKLYTMHFGKLYPNYVQKAIKKGRTQKEVDEIIMWLTGYQRDDLSQMIDSLIDVRTFFKKAPHFNEKAHLITGSICGVKIEEIEDPLMKKIRYLDKLIDELAKGKPIEKIFRQ